MRNNIKNNTSLTRRLMMRKTLLQIIACLVATTGLTGLTTARAQEKGEPMSVRMVKSEMLRNPSPLTIDFNVKKKWNYTHGLLLQSMLQCADRYPALRSSVDGYVKQYLDSLINADGSICTYRKTNYTLDHINAGKMLIAAYLHDPQPRYKTALDTLYSQLQSHPRVAEGGFWHKKVYPHQMWLDGIYMEAPFYCEYAKRFLKGEEQEAAYRDVVNQIMVIARHTYDPDCGLYRHAWDEAKSQPWANPVTGQSEHVWGRALGWYCMAMVDVLGLLPEGHPGQDSILSVLTPLCQHLVELQDPDYGAWYQVMDVGQMDGNYLETSGTAMFAYTFIKGAQNGWLPKEYLDHGRATLDALQRHFMREEPDGTVSLTRVCAVAGLSANRDGSFRYYISEPVRDNDPKAVGPYIMASLMVE